MENLRKKDETEIQNTKEGHSNRIEQTEDRISESEHEMAIKEKTEELLVKQHKTCEKKMQELTNFIKRPNLRIMGIEEGEEGQTKGMHNIFNKMIAENFPNLENNAHIGTGSLRTDLTKIELPHDILLLRQQVQKPKKEY
jgi:hypothetical protein